MTKIILKSRKRIRLNNNLDQHKVCSSKYNKFYVKYFTE